MDKLKMHSVNKVDENIRKIGALFPNCITERKNADGEVEYAIDFDMLRQELSSVVVEGNEERYQFTWPDKKKSILLANAPISKTLRPCREESVDFDNTENLYIEGDNLDVLKLLQETYLGKIKMIYIDPPYNTGNDFVYNDDFAESADEYLANSGQFDEEGNRLVENTESNGRFHTDWLNMLYPRLKIAKDLLTEDGSIFISIDDNEVENLRKACDEIFGDANFIAQISVIVKTEGRQYGHFAKTHEYLLIYAKSAEAVSMNEIRVADGEFKYYDEKGGFNTIGLRNRAVRIFNSTNRPNLRYPFYVNVKEKDQYGFSKVSTIPIEDWQEVWASVVDGLESVWRWGKETAEKNKDELVALQGNDGEIRIFKKDRDLTTLPKTVWFEKELNSIVGTREVASLVGKGMFDFPKPLYLLKRIVEIATDENSLVLDFFSGSSTTAHAVMQINALDNGKRKFIMVQLPEKTAQKSEAYKVGYTTICDIAKERIRRAAVQVKEEGGMMCPDIDTGFRVLKLDSSNMKDVYYSPADYDFSLFDNLADNIKEDRTAEDLLFQVMLDLGILLSSKIQMRNVELGNRNYTYFDVADNFLIACFDNDIDEEVITEIAKKKPYYFVMRDSSMSSDSVATNFDQIFATYSPNTVRKIL